MGIFSGLFHSRDKPKNRTSGSAYTFYTGRTTSGKAVTQRSAMQMTAVYFCVRILSEAIASLPLHLYRYTDNGGKEKATDSPFEIELNKLGINHKLIPPRTPWHNGKVERSHRNDQRYFYDWETFRNIEELNTKLKGHLEWSNNKTMRTLDYKSPMQLLSKKSEKLELKSIH